LLRSFRHGNLLLQILHLSIELLEFALQLVKSGDWAQIDSSVMERTIRLVLSARRFIACPRKTSLRFGPSCHQRTASYVALIVSKMREFDVRM